MYGQRFSELSDQIAARPTSDQDGPVWYRSVQAKIALLTIVPLILLGGANVTLLFEGSDAADSAFQSMAQAQQDGHALADTTTAVATNIRTMMVAVGEFSARQQKALLTGTERDLAAAKLALDAADSSTAPVVAAFARLIEAISDQFGEAGGKAADADEAELRRHIAFLERTAANVPRLLGMVAASSTRTAALIGDGDLSAARANFVFEESAYIRVLNDTVTRLAEIANGTTALVAGLQANLEQRIRDGAAEQQRWTSDLALIIDILVVLALSVGAFLFARYGLAKPIKGLTDTTTRLASGDRRVVIPSTARRDEVGSMAKAVQVFMEDAIKMDAMHEEQMTAKQRERETEQAQKQRMLDLADHFERTVLAVVNNVSTACEEMRDAAQSMASMADDTTKRVERVDQATEGAATNVQSVAAASEEMAASIGVISERGNESADMAQDAASKADAANTSVSGLVEASQRVGEVVALISEIASQTNLLALNATIEAARAGDAGRGFAVVAESVKALAMQTSRATEDISAQVANIQGATNDASIGIRDIVKSNQGIRDISTAIAASVGEQSTATSEISRSARDAALDTDRVKEDIVGVRQAAGENGEAATAVALATKDMLAEADALHREVQTFLSEVRAGS